MRQFRDNNTHEVSTLDEIRDFYKANKVGLVKVPVALLEDVATQEVMSEFSLTTRNMPFTDNGKKVLIGKAY